jgi:hypothetical protein
MKRFFALLSPVALLLASACNCRENDPAPAQLEGRWSQMALIDYHFDAAGQLTQQQTYPAEPFYWDFTADSLHMISVVNPSVRSNYKLTQNGDSVAFGYGRAKIQELTAHKLALRFKVLPASANQPYREEKVIFSR